MEAISAKRLREGTLNMRWRLLGLKGFTKGPGESR
jgi:hypothetical protein